MAASVALPQVLLCILAVLAVFTFILSTLVCCLLRFIGVGSGTDPERQELLSSKPTLVYFQSNADSRYVPNTLLYKMMHSVMLFRLVLDHESDFLTTATKWKCWKSWNAQWQNVAVPPGCHAETQL